MVNTPKTEWAAVSATDNDCRNVKRLRSLITIPVDIKWLFQQAAIESRRIHALWLQKDHVSIESSLYRVSFLPTLLYNCCTWGATNSWIGIDAFRRGLPPAPHPHFRIVEFRKHAPEMTSDLVGYVRTTQIRTVNLRAMISARESSCAVYFPTRGTPHNRSVCAVNVPRTSFQPLILN